MLLLLAASPRTVYFVKILEKFLEVSFTARDFVLVFDFIENIVLEFQDGQCQICFGNQNTRLNVLWDCDT